MREKADKLEKGKWYADMAINLNTEIGLLRYSHKKGDRIFFSENRGDKYLSEDNGLIPFSSKDDYWYLPTQEDIEKYNLNETE